MPSLAITETTYGPTSNQSWIHQPQFLDKMGATVDLASFLAEDQTIGNGVILCGIAVQFDSGLGLFVPYDGVATKVQTITRTATGGNVDVTVDGETAEGAVIVAATTASQVKDILTGLSNIDDDDITVTGAAGGPFLVTGNIPDIDIDDTNATGGTVLVAVTTDPGDGGTAEFRGYIYDDIPIPAGMTTGNLGCSIVIGGVIREARLPLAGEDDGTPGKPDTAAITTFTGRTRLVHI